MGQEEEDWVRVTLVHRKACGLPFVFILYNMPTCPNVHGYSATRHHSGVVHTFENGDCTRLMGSDAAMPRTGASSLGHLCRRACAWLLEAALFRAYHNFSCSTRNYDVAVTTYAVV